ncbi:head GIN domain-containing protein [Sphingomonas sp. M6A6_1c]
MQMVAIVMLGAMLAGCSMSDGDGPGVTPTGSGTTRSYAVADFSNIDLTGSDEVEVRAGKAFSVRAEGKPEDLDTLRIAKDEATLEIGRKRSFRWGHGGKVTVYVTLPRLAQASVTGSGTMAVDRVAGDAFKAEVTGSGDLNIAALTADRVEVSIAGTGNVRAGGAVKELTVEVAGTGSLDAAGLRVARADVSVNGTGDVRAAVSGTAKVQVAGTGDVDLGAAARCTVSNTGTGSVRCGR